jgi:hypothetical protein
MKFYNYIVFSTLFFSAILAGACQKQVDYSEDINNLYKLVASLRKTTDSLTNALSITNNNVSNQTKSIDSIKNQLSIIVTQINTLSTQLSATNANIAAISAQITLLNQQYSALLAQLNLVLAQLNQTPTTLSTGLLAWYPFTGNAKDSSGNNNHGSVYSATLTTDRYGNSNSAYNFNAFKWTWGSGGEYIYIPYSSSFNSANLSVSVWFMKSPVYISNQDACIINRFEGGYSNPNGQTWYMLVNTNDDSLTSTIYPPSSSNSYASIFSSTGPKVTNGVWNNAILTFDGSNMKIYFNGLLVNTIPANGMTMNVNGRSGISIGTSIQANGHWNPFNGKIDDVRIYNRPLTQSEITYLATH